MLSFPAFEERDARGAYGKAGNGKETETGTGNWKWKLETEVGAKNPPITGAMFLHSVLSCYSGCAISII